MAAVAPDVVKDAVFGVSLVVSGFEIIKAAIAKSLAPAIAFFIAAASTYGVFYL